MPFNYSKKFFLIFFTFLNLPIASNYAVENTDWDDVVKEWLLLKKEWSNFQQRFSQALYDFTGYSFTKNNTVRFLISKIHTSEDYSLKNLNTIEKHIKKGIDPNLHDIYCRTPLFILIETLKNNPEQFAIKLKEFVEYGLDVNKPISHSDTALTHVLSLNYNLWKPLLDIGADVNKKDTIGDLPLRRAMYRNNIEAIKDLLDKGSQITDIDRDKNTVFHWLVNRPYLLQENPEIIETIITHTRFFDDENEAIKTKWALQNWTNDRKLSEEELLKNQTIPEDVQQLILAKLFEEKAFFHAKLYPHFVKIGYYDEQSLIPAKRHVERFLEILTIKNTKGKTAAQIVQKRINAPNRYKEEFEQLQSLSDGTTLKKDMNALIQAKDLSQVPPNNLALRILNNYKHLNLNIHIPQE